MDDSNKSASFSWRTQVDAPALPVDYSAKESGKRWGYHHDTVGTHIVKTTGEAGGLIKPYKGILQATP